METKVLKDLWEAYNQVYAEQQFDEEIEYAVEYFYEMGLNESGIDILIEELGEEEFVDWITDIKEEYILSEELKKSESKVKTSKAPKGTRQYATTIARVKKQGGSTRMSTDSAPKSVIRKSAVAKAKKSQETNKKDEKDTKKGIFSSISARMKRHKEATQTAGRLAKETGATINKLRKGLGKAWQSASDSKLAQAGRVEIKKGLKRQQKAIDTLAPMAGRAAGRAAAGFIKSLKKEDYDLLLDYLLDEGYADNEDSAILIAENMSSAWIEDILESHPLDRQRLARQKGRPIPSMRYPGSKPKGKSVGK